MSAVAYPFVVLPLAVCLCTGVPCDRTFSEVSTHLGLQLGICKCLNHLRCDSRLVLCWVVGVLEDGLLDELNHFIIVLEALHDDGR